VAPERALPTATVPDIVLAFATADPVPAELDPPPPQADKTAAIVAQRVSFRNPELSLFFNLFPRWMRSHERDSKFILNT